MNDALALLLGAAAAVGAYYAGQRRHVGTSVLPALPSGSDDNHDLAHLNTIVVTCENLAHGAAGTPATDVLTARNHHHDITRMRRNGWGDSHITVCVLHNPGAALALDAIHFRCGTPNCQERAELSLLRFRASLSALTRSGWRNTRHSLEPLSPSCAGTRRRT